jgi:hypothetical protein
MFDNKLTMVYFHLPGNYFLDSKFAVAESFCDNVSSSSHARCYGPNPRKGHVQVSREWPKPSVPCRAPPTWTSDLRLKGHHPHVKMLQIHTYCRNSRKYDSDRFDFGDPVYTINTYDLSSFGTLITTQYLRIIPCDT